MRVLIAAICVFTPVMTICVSYRQCVAEFQTMRTQLQMKQAECRQTKENLDTAYEVKLRELIEKQKAELEDAERSIAERHFQEREDLKEEYEQDDD